MEVVVFAAAAGWSGRNPHWHQVAGREQKVAGCEPAGPYRPRLRHQLRLRCPLREMSLASHSAGRKKRMKKVRPPSDCDGAVGTGDGGDTSDCMGGDEVAAVEEVDRKLIDAAEWMRASADSDRQRCIRKDCVVAAAAAADCGNSAAAETCGGDDGVLHYRAAEVDGEGGGDGGGARCG